MDSKTGNAYVGRRDLFANGLKSGRVSIQQIEEALPDGSLTAAERWILYYSLRASGIEIVDRMDPPVDGPVVVSDEPISIDSSVG